MIDHFLEFQMTGAMRDSIAKLGKNGGMLHLKLFGKLGELLDSPILVSNDCYVLQTLTKAPPFGLTDFEKSEFEYNENHFHPDDYFENKISLDEHYLQLALDASVYLFNRLKLEFPSNSFTIVVSYSETEFDESEIDIYPSSTVRFYKNRSGIDPMIELAMEPLLIMET